MKYLVIQSSDWADEFNCERYTIFDEEQEAIDAVENATSNGGYFGTNEGWEDGELDANDFSIQTITDELAETLTVLLGKEFGTGLYLK